MTREEIKNTPELVDYLLDQSVIADSRKKLHKRMDEICNLAIQALEKEPKSEWEHDHEILKAYSDGANEILDKIRAEIMSKDGLEEALEIIDKYEAKVIPRGNCMMCGKELTEGLFFCKECEGKGKE